MLAIKAKNLKKSSSMLIWITGLSGAGKTTIAAELYAQLKPTRPHLAFLDGDKCREIFGQDVGYDYPGRLTMARRMSRMCQYLTVQGIDVICATISMYREIHEFNRENIKNYYEIFIDVSLDNLIKYDKNNLYSGALKGKTKNVIGIDMPFKRPEKCDLIIDNNERKDLQSKVMAIIKLINKDERYDI
ncbi:MAG: adenylyl-sulfate kinase [Prevotella sp.]|nr:adenylyl-sulfate kinase [Prevotella sp.]